MNELTGALIMEIGLQSNYLSEPVNTIYFGGGTPSFLSFNSLDKLMNAIYSTYNVHHDAEVTIEANPEDISNESLDKFQKIGFNRLSLGIQCFDDVLLKLLNRNHSSLKALEAIEFVEESAFSNYNIDLIYGIPGLSLDGWKNSLSQIVALNPKHISCYSLTIEERTVLGEWSKKQKFTAVPEDDVATQFELMSQMLIQGGYRHYEVSNFAMHGYESRHNQSYWTQKPYLGIGPSAHSYDGHSRQQNIANNASYCKSINRNKIPFIQEMLSKTTKLNEYLLTRLRTGLGINFEFLKHEFNHDLSVSQHKLIHTLVRDGQAVINKNTLILTPNGFLLADKIILELMANPK